MPYECLAWDARGRLQSHDEPAMPYSFYPPAAFDILPGMQQVMLCYDRAGYRPDSVPKQPSTRIRLLDKLP